MPRLNCTQVNSLTKDKFLIVCAFKQPVFFVPLVFIQCFFFSVIHQFLMMITELLIEKGIKKNWNNEWCFLFWHCGSRMGNRMVSILFVQQEPIPCYDLGIFTEAGRWSEKIKASLKKWMNKWWVSVKNKDLVDIYSWCTVIGSLCRYHQLKGIKGTKQ